MNTDPETRLEAVQKRGTNGDTLWNQYDCKHCLEAGVEHTVSNVPHDTTDRSSCWGPGIPTTRRECSNCKRWDGPWVSAAIVGGGW
jgi:hypothetical protein